MLDDPVDVLSNVEKDGAWKSRPIDLWGVLKSFVSQLKIGDQITKISLPAEMCYPYSMLEMVAYRQLSLFKTLYGVNEEEDALKRFLVVLKYFACLPRNETHNKKPWNPILGETHMAHVEDEANGRTEFISEQISHHPPVSAFHVRNDHHELEVASNLAFTVKFHGNSASISVSGPSTLQLKKRNETYRFSRCIPAMLVRNLVLGTKYIVWEGECVIQCPETGYEAKITFKEGWSRNTLISGSVYHSSDPKKTLYTLDGQCGSELKLSPKHASVPEKAKFQLVDVSQQKGDTLKYLPPELLEPMSSIIVWGPVNAGVLQHNSALADQEKVFVEAEQRRMRAERAERGVEFQGQYFQQQGDIWVLREGISVSKILSKEIPTIPMASYSARGDHLKTAAPAEPETLSGSAAHPYIIPHDAHDPDPVIDSALEMARHDEVDIDSPPPATEPPTPSATPAPDASSSSSPSS